MAEELSTDDFTTHLIQKRSKFVLTVVGLTVASVFIYIFCLFLGSVGIGFFDVIDVFMGKGDWGNTYIIKELRMPRVACAALVGVGLSVAGMAMQAMFRNPMASPSVLGLSSGAAFGASLAMGLGVGGFMGKFSLSFMAFVFCFITIATVYLLAYSKHGVPIVLLLLSGIAVGTFFNGLTSVLQYGVDKDSLADIVYWTMGSFGRAEWVSVELGLLIIGAGVLMIVLCSKEMNIISMGEEQAKSLGVNVNVTRYMLLVGTALTVGGSVSISGTISFVGLIIPHICRALCGPEHQRLWVLCILVGAIFMMVMDLCCRLISTATGSFPVGALTALVGAPFFIYIMKKRKNELWG